MNDVNPTPESDVHERLAAAERTVAVLKDTVRRLYDEGAHTGIAHQLARAQERQQALEQRRLLTEVRQEELERYSQNLEAEVRSRTADLRAIHDHLTSGFLLIDRSLTVLPGYTRCCHELLATDGIEGVGIIDLLRIDEPRRRAAMEMGLEQIFEDLLPEELAIDQLQSRHEVEQRVLRLDVRCVRDDSGIVATLLVTIVDATALDETARENRRNEVLIRLLTQRGAFTAFVADARTQLEAAIEAIEGGGDPIFVKRAIHTVKGNAASFGLDDVVAVAHEIEVEPFSVDRVTRLARAIEQFLETNGEVLGIEYRTDGTSIFEVERRRAIELQNLVLDCANNAGQLQRWAAELTLKPLRSVLGPVDQYVSNLAERLGKRVRFELIGGDVLVDVEHLRPALSAIAHSIRNAVDHGIEMPEDRIGKSVEATVRLLVEDSGPSWRLVVADDGRGVDVDRLAARALAAGFVTEGQLTAMSRQDKLNLAFIEGLSTNTRATEISGRGTGMGALSSAAVSLGGEATLSSVDGQGATIEVLIPKPQRLLVDQTRVAALEGSGPT